MIGRNRSSLAGSRRGAALVVFTTAAALFASPLSASEARPTATPPAQAAVTGPIDPSIGLGTFDLQGDISQLPTYGYVQEEFFLDGTAQAYDAQGTWGTDGKWDVTPSTTAAYRTRMVVRRPNTGVKFNGTVVVEWYNVTAGFDNAPDWAFSRTELLRRGFAWVGVSAQYVGVEGPTGSLGFGGLKSFDPTRYGSLVHPGDIYSYDIFSQAARAVKNPTGVKPLANLKAERLIADGESQSASRMTTYVNAISKVANIFDGFLIHSRSAGASSISLTGTGATPPNPAFIRTDLTTPVITIESETDVPRYSPARQPDTDRIRTWEIAGTSHVDEYGLGPLAIAFLKCNLPVNSGQQHYVMHSAVKHLWRWIQDPTQQPPRGAKIELDGSANVVRDKYGNARGGIRTPALDAPTAVLSGFGNAPAFCTLFGTTTPFTAAQLNDIYKSRGAYLQRYVAATRSALDKGFMLRIDAPSILGEALKPVFP